MQEKNEQEVILYSFSVYIMYYTRGYMSVMLHTFNDKTESNASLNILIHPASKGTSNPIKEKKEPDIYETNSGDCLMLWENYQKTSTFWIIRMLCNIIQHIMRQLIYSVIIHNYHGIKLSIICNL